MSFLRAVQDKGAWKLKSNPLPFAFEPQYHSGQGRDDFLPVHLFFMKVTWQENGQGSDQKKKHQQIVPQLRILTSQHGNYQNDGENIIMIHHVPRQSMIILDIRHQITNCPGHIALSHI